LRPASASLLPPESRSLPADRTALLQPALGRRHGPARHAALPAHPGLQHPRRRTRPGPGGRPVRTPGPEERAGRGRQGGERAADRRPRRAGPPDPGGNRRPRLQHRLRRAGRRPGRYRRFLAPHQGHGGRRDGRPRRHAQPAGRAGDRHRWPGGHHPSGQPAAGAEPRTAGEGLRRRSDDLGATGRTRRPHPPVCPRYQLRNLRHLQRAGAQGQRQAAGRRRQALRIEHRTLRPGEPGPGRHRLHRPALCAQGQGTGAFRRGVPGDAARSRADRHRGLPAVAAPVLLQQAGSEQLLEQGPGGVRPQRPGSGGGRAERLHRPEDPGRARRAPPRHAGQLPAAGPPGQAPVGELPLPGRQRPARQQGHARRRAPARLPAQERQAGELAGAGRLRRSQAGPGAQHPAVEAAGDGGASRTGQGRGDLPRYRRTGRCPAGGSQQRRGRTDQEPPGGNLGPPGPPPDFPGGGRPSPAAGTHGGGPRRAPPRSNQLSPASSGSSRLTPPTRFRRPWRHPRPRHRRGAASAGDARCSPSRRSSAPPPH